MSSCKNEATAFALFSPPFQQSSRTVSISACLLHVVDAVFLILATLIIFSKTCLVSSLGANSSRVRGIDLLSSDSEFSINEQTSAFLSVAEEWQDC